jgi:nitrite reductase/ring-hydroxylating ferredoxin subunit
MAEKFVAKASEFTDGDRRIVFVGDNEIGVFRHAGQFYAYSNFCLHQGGPACEGLTIAKVEERLRPDKTSQGLYFSETDMNVVCPWHGMEYDMKTGECISNRRDEAGRNSRSCRKDEVYVVVRARRRKAACRATCERQAEVRGRKARAGKAEGVANAALSAEAIRLADEIERAFAKSDDAISPEAMQTLMAALCRVYAAQIDNGAKHTPIPEGQIVSPTGVMLTASGLLRAANLAVFELGMWQSWTGR